MNFWNNPEYNSLKVLFFVVLIAGGGFFVYNSMHGNSLEGAGRVYAPTTQTDARATSVPVVSTKPASDIAATSAVLHGTVTFTTANNAVSAHFIYGTTTEYGKVSANAAVNALGASAPVAGLSCGTTYHYKITASNAAGMTNGGDMKFTTASCGSTR